MNEEIQMTNDQSVERIDPLTGVGNLLAFLETFTWHLAASEWTDFSLLLVDINNFNQFNIEHGHARGDAVLRWISIAMKDLQAPVYRIGGDEIVAVLMEGTHETGNPRPGDCSSASTARAPNFPGLIPPR